MRTLLHLYGPLGIQSFGLTLATGLLIVLSLLKRHPLRKHLISLSQLNNLIVGSALFAFLGGKLLFLVYNTQHVSYFTLEGFSLFGSVGSILLFLTIYVCCTSITLLPLLDLFALHAPCLQSIARIGCFLTGCCYGTHSSVFWTVTYKDPTSLAPLNVSLHPTQLYSALLLAGIYLFLSKNFCRTWYAPGRLAMYYLMLMSLERFFIDFFRGDREFVPRATLSVHQWIALLVFVGASGILITLRKTSLPRTI